MILKSRNIEIPQDDPFSNDVLDRRESAEVLTEFILSGNEPLVVCIDAPWGQGKTTFLKMWEQHLKNEDIPTLYFNAWENDFCDDALVCLIGEISASIKELSKTGDESKAREYLDKAKGLGASLLKRSVPVAAKIATAGALDLDKITEQSLSGFAESVAKEQLEKYESSKKSLKAFREALSELASSITSQDSPKPLVIIIDELDRCRPNHSIEILEKAKHLFNVDNIVFILGADKVQLGSSIKAIYGEGLNVNGYLSRFIDFDYILPPPTKGQFVNALFNKFSFNEYFSKKYGNNIKHEKKQSLYMFSELFEIYKLTLREQEHCCSLLSLSIRTTPHNEELSPLFLCFLIVVKVKTPDVYKRLITDEINPLDLLNQLKGVPGFDEVLSNNYGTALETYIVTCKSRRYEHEVESRFYNSILKSETASATEKQRAAKVLEIVDDHHWDGGIDLLGNLIKKIEIASRFKV